MRVEMIYGGELRRGSPANEAVAPAFHKLERCIDKQLTPRNRD